MKTLKRRKASLPTPPPLELLASSYRDNDEREIARDRLKVGLIEIAARSITNDVAPSATKRAQHAEDLFLAALALVDAQLQKPNSRSHSDWPSCKRRDAIEMALWLARLATTCPGANANEQAKFAASLCHLIGAESGPLDSFNVRIIARHTLETRPIPSRFIPLAEALERIATNKGKISLKQFRNLWVDAVLRELSNYDAWLISPPVSIEELGWRTLDSSDPVGEAKRRREVSANLRRAFRHRLQAGSRAASGKPSGLFEEYVIDRIVEWRRAHGRQRV